MKRRDFMKLAGAAGMMLASPVTARAQEEPQIADLYDGLFFVFVAAGGGWDPTSFCDPKGFISENDDNPMNRGYAAADIGNTGNIRWAPFDVGAPGSGYRQFVETHYEKMLVINGIDTQTNGHDSGARHAAAGKLAEGFPTFGALVASEYGRGLPMSYISNGYYDETAGKVARTRVSNIGVFERIARPNAINVNNPDDGYHTPETFQRIREAQESRLLALRGINKLPKLERSMATLHLARGGDNVLQRLLDYLPEDQAPNGLQRQAQLAIAAYKAGTSVAVNLSRGGFDTHGNHDQNHLPRLDDVWTGVDYLLQEAERQGVADKVVICVGSDFGRTPGYNENNGKDHWSVTSMILMGAGIRGNRTIGETTERHSLKTVDPNTLQVINADTGVRIEPGHVHAELRKLAGIDKSRLNAEFQLDIKEHLNLLA